MLVLDERNLRKASLRELAEAVYMLVQLVPIGRVTTYGSIASLLGISPRLVGRILGMNPEPIVVPCHRVVKSGGKLGGYSMPGGPRIKRKILVLEGVSFTPSGRIRSEHIIDLGEMLGISSKQGFSHTSTRDHYRAGRDGQEDTHHNG